MVCANKEARYVRELDLFRHKLGIKGGCGRYTIIAQNELRSSADKFLVERDRDPRGECEGR